MREKRFFFEERNFAALRALRGFAVCLCCSTSACIGSVTPSQCAVDVDCGTGAICAEGTCHPGSRQGDGGVCPLVQPKWSEINAHFIQIGCGVRDSNTTICHSVSGAATSSGLDLQGDPYDRLVDRPSADGGFVLVKPGDPDASFLAIKLKLTSPFDPVYGSGMPPDFPGQNCAAIQDAVRQWIAAGAPRN